MSGAHASPRQDSIGVAVWRPIMLLATLGVGAPAAVVSGAVDAHSAPSRATVPDTAAQAAAVGHTAPTRPCRCGTSTCR
ncbi:hypothetical protein [Streptomyces inhibens]|uniref:hypothetical protein n=1 Tax=Streptomyces inhibens TaxID=2293571 RepID=UPI001EE74F99|nr:hypothetical protein [Streptomyces inhibens]UKY47819.1 hypothetical protein KI385_02550 [Streptomyces inhibens]